DALYGKFIQRNAGTFDWRQYPETTENSATAPASDWTWGNPANDPCKSLGNTWRMPTQAERTQIASNNTWVWQDGGTNGTSGYQIKPGGTNKPTALFLPAAGSRSRSNGAQYSVGSLGYYWSSSFMGATSYNLYFTSESISATGTHPRANGFSVRCVSE
ncbi:MAG: fibrobacter succinogenes major paralogous domain-containing protein, partial [Dysgonamonadaceae bacterium]|nr:fibrobacter succinogenes major paralogous domain-containing protein [Dysgonamonadaceae bacterium]